MLGVKTALSVREDVRDAALALSLAALGLGQLYLWDPTPARYVLTLPALAQTIPLAARRRAPVAVFLWTAAALVAVRFPPIGVDEPPLGSMLAFFVALYTLAANEPRRRSIPVVTSVGVLMVAALSWGQDASSLLWASITFALLGSFGWWLGDAFRQRRAEVRELGQRATRLEAEREAAAETERSRIARELHDVVAHSMSVMVVQASAARRLGPGEEARAQEALRSIEESGRDALAEMRRLVGILRHDGSDAPLAPQPGLGQIDTLVRQAREAGLSVHLELRPGPRPLPPGIDLSAYRIVQEALTNTLRHAGAQHLWISLRWGPEALDLEVRDDGRGVPDAAAGGHGHGLIGMRERASFFGGQLETGPGAPGGYVVRARLPLHVATLG